MKNYKKKDIERIVVEVKYKTISGEKKKRIEFRSPRYKYDLYLVKAVVEFCTKNNILPDDLLGIQIMESDWE